MTLYKADLEVKNKRLYGKLIISITDVSSFLSEDYVAILSCNVRLIYRIEPPSTLEQTTLDLLTEPITDICDNPQSILLVQKNKTYFLFRAKSKHIKLNFREN